MRFGAFDIWGVSSAVKFLSISVTLGFCAHYICGLHGTSLQAPWLLTAPQECGEDMLLEGPPHSAWDLVWGLATENCPGNMVGRLFGHTPWVTQLLHEHLLSLCWVQDAPGPAFVSSRGFDGSLGRGE